MAYENESYIAEVWNDRLYSNRDESIKTIDCPECKGIGRKYYSCCNIEMDTIGRQVCPSCNYECDVESESCTECNGEGEICKE